MRNGFVKRIIADAEAAAIKQHSLRCFYLPCEGKRGFWIGAIGTASVIGLIWVLLELGVWLV